METTNTMCPDAMNAAQADRKWFRVIGTKGNAKGNTGVEGRLVWLAVEGNPKAWASSPDALKVSRVGLAVEGRSGLLFLNPRHVIAIAQPTTAEGLVAVEIMCHAFASL